MSQDTWVCPCFGKGEGEAAPGVEVREVRTPGPSSWVSASCPCQESMADVKTQLHLVEKEKRGLELGTYTLGAQEAAYLLLIEHLQQERDAGSGPPSPGSSTSESSTGSSGAGVSASLPPPGTIPHSMGPSTPGPCRDGGACRQPAPSPTCCWSPCPAHGLWLGVL